MKKKEIKQNIEEETILEELAEKIKLLYFFLADLIPHKEKLKEMVEKTEELSSMTLSMAPIIGASVQNYEEIYLQREIERKRALALLNLIEVLDETEKEIEKFERKQAIKRRGLAKIRKLLGS